jgi:hypothetical protein
MDTSVICANPEPAEWQAGPRVIFVISDVVLGELEGHKTKPLGDQARVAADQFMSNVASLATSRSLAQGLEMASGSWLISESIDRARLARGLNAKNNDQQIAGLAGIVSSQLTGVPTLLLTGDINQMVFASSVGIPGVLDRHPFAEQGRRALTDLMKSVRESPHAWRTIERLENNLPPRETIVTSLIGREDELAELEHWLLDPGSKKWSLTGYGGKGKTAIAYIFAERVVDAGSPRPVTRVLWMSAKRKKFLDRQVTPVSRPDFANLDEALDFILTYYSNSVPNRSQQDRRQRAIEWLTLFPALLVVDDLDSLERENEDAAEFFLDDVLLTGSKVLLTSRSHYPAMGRRETEIKGLKGDAAHQLVIAKATEFGLDPGRFDASLDRIVRVTEGSPLYIEDLIRSCVFSRVSDAITRWEQHSGDEARRFALLREIELLTETQRQDRAVLICCAEADGPVTVELVGHVCRLAPHEVEDSIRHLRQFYLIPEPTVVEDVVWFDLSGNIRALVKLTYETSAEAKQIRGALVGLGLHPAHKSDAAKLGAVGQQVRQLVFAERHKDAEAVLLDNQKRYGERPELLQLLGWLYSRWPPRPRVTDARDAFRWSHELGYKHANLYWYWAEFEERQGDWHQAIHVSQLGLERTNGVLDLEFRLAQARFGLALDYLSRVDDEAGRGELDEVLRTARAALSRSEGGGNERTRLRLREVAFRALERHPRPSKTDRTFFNAIKI